MNDKKTQLWTIVYQIPMTNAQLFGDLDSYITVTPEPIEPEITEFSEANDVIARIKAGL